MVRTETMERDQTLGDSEDLHAPEAPNYSASTVGQRHNGRAHRQLQVPGGGLFKHPVWQDKSWNYANDDSTLRGLSQHLRTPSLDRTAWGWSAPSAAFLSSKAC